MFFLLYIILLEYSNQKITNENKESSISYNHMDLPLQIIFSAGGKIDYLYDASGKKLKKTVFDGTTTTITDYLSGFQYVNGTRDLFPTAEGYVKCLPAGGARPARYNYAYNLTDHLGNIRVTYGMDNYLGKIVILEENHYYPFGMKHEKYNSDKYEYVVNQNGDSYFVGIEPLGPQQRRTYQYKYQGQERQDELGLNWDSFKWRNYDYALGRFMNVDKLAEDYSYQSPYNFAENRVIDGREMEGLEWTSSTSSDGKTVNLNLNVRTVNNSVGIISNEQMAILANERAAQLSSSLGGVDSSGRTVNVTVSYSDNATMIWEYTNALNARGVKDLVGKSEESIATTLALANGITDEIGNTQVNRTQLNIASNDLMQFDGNGNAIFDNKTTRAKTAQTGAHEDLHTLGGRHETDPLNNSSSRDSQKKDKNNLINESATGTNVLPTQRSEFIQLIENQQK